MKKILLAIFSLISVISYSQTTGYLRYDTVRIQRGGGNSTLVIENATRTLTNGFLQNYAEGRTKFAYALDSVWIDGDSIRFRYGTTTLAVLSPPSYTDADARAAISLTTTGTSGAATYNSGTGVFNIPVYAGTLNANAGAFYRWLKPASQEIKTFANGYGILIDSTTNTDALTAILDSATVFPQIRASIAYPNLRVERAGAGIPTWYLRTSDTTLMLKDIIGETFISVGTKTDSTNYVRLDTSDTDLHDFIALYGGGGSGTPAGSNTQIQYNNSGAFGASSAFTWDGSKLDIWNGGAGIVVGGDLSAATRTNATNKFGAFAIPHYTNSEEPFSLIRGAATSTSNIVSIGAGLSPGLNSATSVDIYTTPTTTSLSGIRRASFSPTAVQLNEAGADYDLQVRGDNDANALYVDASADAVGVGTATPDRKLHSEVSDATTNTIVYPFRGSHTTSGTAAAGGGVGFEMETENASGTMRVTGSVTNPMTDATNASEDADYTINLIRAGTLTEGFRVTSVGGITVNGSAGTAGQVLTSGGAGAASTWAAATKPTLTKNATIENPTASENMGWFRTPVAITITNTHAVLVGSGSPSVTYQISFGTDITSLTNVYSAGQTVTSTTTGDAASGVNDATIPANSWIRITTSASTTTTQISLSITYTED